MAPTSSTGTDALPLRDRQRLEALLDLYERERVMYGEVLELARTQLAAVRRGADMDEIRTLLEKKKQMLDMIASMEGQFSDARELWERHRGRLSGELPSRMHDGLRRLGGVIEEILDEEARTDRLFLEQAGGA